MSAKGGWRSQFGNPHGALGWLMGHLLAIKNRERSLWVLSLLDIQPRDRILEIGFGSGVDIRRAASLAGEGFVAGVDHSELMLRQATRRNGAAIRAGRVDLRHASAAALPFPDQSFDKVFSINAAQFWKVPLDPLHEIRRVLRPGGIATIAVQPRGKGATEETAIETGRALVKALTAGGFERVMLASTRLDPVSVVCAMGVKA